MKHTGWHIHSRFSLRVEFSSCTFTVLPRTDLFSHTQFSFLANAGFPTDHEQRDQRFSRLDFCMKERANRSYMLMQFSWENLDTITILPLLGNSWGLSTLGWNSRLEVFFSSPSPMWPYQTLDLPGLWNSPKVSLFSRWSWKFCSALQSGVLPEHLGLPQEPGLS